MLMRLIRFVVLAPTLLLFWRDTRILDYHLERQRLPWLLRWCDSPIDYRLFGLNGPIEHQAEELLGHKGPIRYGLLVNAVQLMYDRELTAHDFNVPASKIYMMRLKWLVNRK